MIAVALSPKARALIQAHREARRPTAADRERVAAALRLRLGAAVLPLDAPVKPPWLTIGRFAAACGVCVAGTALFLAQRPEGAHQSTTPTRSVEAAPSVSAVLMPNLAADAAETPATPERKSGASSAPKARTKVSVGAVPAQDTLAQELLLLTSATSQLSSRQATAALVALDEHQRRFSHGVLSNERNVAKARALCMLHRFDEGRATLALLGGGTPAAARVKEECDSARARADATRKAESE